MTLNKDQFLECVQRMPLVSIDLVITRQKSILLGMRTNRPAQGFWFVPGGRILKDETLGMATQRIAAKELGISNIYAWEGTQPRLLGAYEHHYEDCFAGDIGVTTHYVVLAYHLAVGDDVALLRHDEQHEEFRWWGLEEATQSNQVHEYTQNYLKSFL